ncbi:hypothetical protein PR202_ga27188 [Eleusine coracana subsp. coracana]|uniref:Transcription factor GTE1 n=1 Tax=Eleusine coracana subsp. coracana TaxID=191504 RepID=A0AAV5DEK7_ELECO|nr:hypothetical protein PR202_ga27188 [Eleusine coracana subsp. coracana]
MTPVNGAPGAAEVVAPPELPPEAESEVDGFRRQVDDLISKTDVLERRVNEVVDFYDGKKHGSGGRKASGGSRGGHSRGMPDLMRQFGGIMREATHHIPSPQRQQMIPAPAMDAGAMTILFTATSCFHRSWPFKLQCCPKPSAAISTAHYHYLNQSSLLLRTLLTSILCPHGSGTTSFLAFITSDKLAWPFLKPVDVKALQLDDYYKIISKPMDFSTIEKKMEGRDGTKYSSVREIYSDVRLIFTNAMKYNDEQNEIHLMAKALLEKFEEKWLHFLPKVESEEKRQKEESKDVAPTNASREASIAKLAKVTDEELNEINKQLDKLRKMVVQRCRKMTTDEKRKLGAGLCHLSPDDLSKALEIVAQDNPSFQTKAEEVDLDMDAQSETTLWRLKFFVREALERQANVASGKDENAKRKRDIVSALAKTASKRIKRQP